MLNDRYLQGQRPDSTAWRPEWQWFLNPVRLGTLFAAELLVALCLPRHGHAATGKTVSRGLS